MSFKISRSKRQKSTGARAFFIPLSQLSVTLDYRPMREIQLPLEVQISHVPFCASSSVVGNAVAIFSTEVLSRLLSSNGPDENLYTDLSSLVLKMDDLPECDLASFHLELLILLVRHFGILPQTDQYCPGYVLSFSDGIFRPISSLSDRAHQRGSHTLYRCLTEQNLYSVTQNRKLRKELLELLLEHLAHYYPIVGDLRSPSVLSELF